MPDKGRLPEELAENTFFKERDNAQVKYEMLRREATTDESVTKVSAKFGFTRKTFYDAKARFEGDGLAGLLDRSPGPKGPRKLTPPVEDAILRIKKGNPTYKVPQVFEALCDECSQAGIEVAIGPKTVERVLTSHGLHTPRLKKNSR